VTRRSSLLSAASAAGVAALLLPSPALAQRGHPPHGGGTHVVVGGGVYYGASFYYPYAYPWYPFGFWYPAPYYYGPTYYDNSSSLQLQVTPRETEVFVDGHFAGIVDNFDGTFQRLHVEPGEHELQLFLPGHKAVTQHVYLQPRNTFRVKYTMEMLGPGEPEPVRPVGTTQEPPRSGRAADTPTRPTITTVREGTSGSVAIRVQPADADILIDGERWTGNGDDRLVVQLSPGRHQIEVRKDGYRQFSTEVEIRAGESAPLNVSLGRLP
jgi:PEGA domain-containing protein